jgi:hydroxyacylglutathione hydrolase
MSNGQQLDLLVDEGLGNTACLVDLGDGRALERRMGDLPAAPTAVMCGHGERAMGAASLLARAGHRDLAVLSGGPDDWAGATDGCLARGG